MQQTTETEGEAARARVTPRELAQATAIIEARREAEAKHLADTIALGEAVQQLGLATTPEELFAEVQTLRASAQESAGSAAATQFTANLKQQSRNGAMKQLASHFALMACVTTLFIAVFIPWISRADSSTQMEIAAAVEMPMPAPASSSVTQNGSPAVGETNLDEFKSLALKEGQSVHCGLEDIEALAQGDSPAELFSTEKTLELTWELKRLSGRLRVQGWATRANAARIAKGQSATVAGFKWAQESVPVTLPLKAFINPVSPDTGQDVVRHIQINDK